MNEKLTSLKSVPKLDQVDVLSRARSAREGEEWYWINVARMGVWAIKRQLGGMTRNRMCRRDGENDTDIHCVTECSNTASIRTETGVSQFFIVAKMRGVSVQKA